MLGHDLGKAITVIHRFVRGCDEDDEFGRAMGAPMGELRPIIAKGRAKSFRRIRRQVKAVTGLRWNVFLREVERRTSPRWMHFNFRYDF